jgi:hypothetical protein
MMTHTASEAAAASGFNGRRQVPFCQPMVRLQQDPNLRCETNPFSATALR